MPQHLKPVCPCLANVIIKPKILVPPNPIYTTCSTYKPCGAQTNRVSRFLILLVVVDAAVRKEHSAGLLPYSCMCSLFILLVDEAGPARVVKFNVSFFFM